MAIKTPMGLMLYYMHLLELGWRLSHQYLLEMQHLYKIDLSKISKQI